MVQHGPGTIDRRPAGTSQAPGSVLRGGPPAPARTLWDVFVRTVADHPRAAAIDGAEGVLDYRALHARVEDLARRLRAAGVGRCDRVGVRVTSGTCGLYVAVLAVLRSGAAYVPVDVDDPPERARTVFAEAAVCAVVTDGERILPGPVRPRRIPSGVPAPDDDAWIIFTSGSTGTPKGVAVSHRSAAAFVDAESRLFVRPAPLGPRDRVLAGLSVAFDASCEEMWLAWRHGACLVPAPRALVRGGVEFGDWLVRRAVTVVSTVPSLAGLWSAEQLRGVRLLVLGGEACPQPLAHRLAHACTEVWNTYGPTETTVVATAARLTADGPVLIGRPLPGWDVAVVDPVSGVPVPPGEVGELLIAGVGTARYLDRGKDRERFPAVPGLGWDRAYRSGDLVRAEPAGLTFVGRVDGQVKIRGFRVELSEIEAVLAGLPGVAAAAVATHEVRPGVRELVAYWCDGPGAAVDEQRLADGLRRRLPAHMVPAFFERLAALPVTTSGKVDRAALPAPSARGTTAGHDVVAPATPTESALAASLTGLLGLDEVSVTSHLVDDLHADSLTLARFAARVREQRGPGCPLGMRRIYQNPTLRLLAAHLDATAPAAAVPDRPEATGAGRWQHAAVGAAQLLAVLLALAAGSVITWGDVSWIDAATGALDLFERSTTALAATFLLLTAVPVTVKWVLVGRWRPAEIPLWSAAYLRFWVVATLVRASPMALFAGSPLYLLYLRALGARVGRGAVVFSRTVPVCTDMLEIGDEAVVRKGASFTGYRAERGTIVTGPVTIGRGAVVSEATHLDVDTAVGTYAQLGHASSLARGQRIPDHRGAHGSPAVPTTSDFRGPATMRCTRRRRALFAVLQLLNLLVIGPALLTVAVEALSGGSRITAPFDGVDPAAVLALCLSGTGLGWSLALSAAALVAGLVLVATAPRLLGAVLRPGRVHPLYGFAYWCHRAVSRLTNVPGFVQLFGDSSFVVGYLRLAGYRIARGGQTGSNFGADVSHENPYLVSVGPNTMVSDGVAFASAEFTHSSFRVAPVSLGADCFLGSVISVPTGGRIGDGCLVGTKTMVPADGPVRRDVGLLGSPPFEFPRVRPDVPPVTGARLAARLAAKDRHNLVTMALFLLVSWARLHLLLTVGLVAASTYSWAGPFAVGAGVLAAGVLDLAFTVLVERAVTGFRALTPRYCSIYDRYFWWHERFWKLSVQPSLLNGTPFKPLVWRLLGVDIGHRVFDDGASISEKTLVAIGDGTTLNAGVILQAHSMEDGVFRSDHIRIGARATLGRGAFVHYDTVVGDGATLEPDAFLMKGERVGAGSTWVGNPAGPATR